MALQDPEYVKELFSVFGPVSVRRMFGGAGIFADGLMIALIAGGELFLKADAQTVPAFQAEGTGPFEYGAKGRRVILSYWRMPERLFDDQDELAQWARDAFRAAQRSAAAKPARRKSKPKTGKPKKRSIRKKGKQRRSR